ncbi:MAG: hypothetical protein CMK09_03990 [Ponticaulis sp.]|nr:hypothetical protein [Ponticaulis sp.]
MNDDMSELRNLGLKSARLLKEAGVLTISDLKEMGADRSACLNLTMFMSGFVTDTAEGKNDQRRRERLLREPARRGGIRSLGRRS